MDTQPEAGEVFSVIEDQLHSFETFNFASPFFVFTRSNFDIGLVSDRRSHGVDQEHSLVHRRNKIRTQQEKYQDFGEQSTIAGWKLFQKEPFACDRYLSYHSKLLLQSESQFPGPCALC